MNGKTFELKEISMVQAGKNILWTYVPFMVGLLFSFAYAIANSRTEGIFIHLRDGLIFFGVVYLLRRAFNFKNKTFAHSFIIQIIDQDIIIKIDNELAYSGKIEKIKAIRTLDLSNKKNDVQGQIFIESNIFNLSCNLNRNNKIVFDEFVTHCISLLKLHVKPVPFSVFTHNAQGIKYLEYYNPQNPLI